MELIDGKKISAEVKQEIAAEVEGIIKNGGKKASPGGYYCWT